LTLAFADPAAALSSADGSAQADPAVTARPQVEALLCHRAARGRPVTPEAQAVSWPGRRLDQLRRVQVRGHLRQDSYIEYAELMAGSTPQASRRSFTGPGPVRALTQVRQLARTSEEASALPGNSRRRKGIFRSGCFGGDAWVAVSGGSGALQSGRRVCSRLKATYILGQPWPIGDSRHGRGTLGRQNQAARPIPGFRLGWIRPGSPRSRMMLLSHQRLLKLALSPVSCRQNQEHNDAAHEA
jgi:hypothetical protein